MGHNSSSSNTHSAVVKLAKLEQQTRRGSAEQQQQQQQQRWHRLGRMGCLLLLPCNHINLVSSTPCIIVQHDVDAYWPLLALHAASAAAAAAFHLLPAVNLPGFFYTFSSSGGPSATLCPENSYSPGLRKQRACVPCPTGFTTNGQTGQRSLTACGKQGVHDAILGFIRGFTTRTFSLIAAAVLACSTAAWAESVAVIML